MPQPGSVRGEICLATGEAGLRSANIAMGAVLSIWHEYREAGLDAPENAKLPPREALEAAGVAVPVR